MQAKTGFERSASAASATGCGTLRCMRKQLRPCGHPIVRPFRLLALPTSNGAEARMTTITIRPEDEALPPSPVEEANGAARTLPMLHAYIPMMTASALATAGRIGLFEALAGGAREVRSLADTLGISVDGAERIVDFLVAAGFLRRAGIYVANGDAAMRWFTSHGVVDYSTGLAWSSYAWGILDDLPAALAEGKPRQLLWDRMAAQPEMGTGFSRYMASFAQHLAPDIVAAVTLPDRPLTLLDLGGSHGHHAITFCHAYPRMKAVIVDLESALTETQVRIEREGLADRITLRPSDLRHPDWGEGYDIALYLSVAHNMSPAENRANFRHLARATKPDGVLILHDYPRETTPALFETAFRLTLLTETGTRTYSYAELGSYLEEAGFLDHHLQVLDPAEKGALITARKRPAPAPR
jgi:SAM-dependent methyltransferase